MKNSLIKALEYQEKLSLNITNPVECQIMKFISKVGDLPNRIFVKYRNDLISGLTSELTNHKSSSGNIHNDIEMFVDETLNKIKNFKQY